MSAWPRSSCTSLGCKPSINNRVAQVCRRLWKGILGSPASLRSGHQERFIRLWQLTGVPALVAKTHSALPFLSLCFFRASFAILVSVTERLPLADFGEVAWPPKQKPVNGGRRGPTGVHGITDPITTNREGHRFESCKTPPLPRRSRFARSRIRQYTVLA